MSKYEDGLEALEGVDVKSELRLTLLVAVCCIGFIAAVRLVIGWLV